MLYDCGNRGLEITALGHKGENTRGENTKVRQVIYQAARLK